jgi:hypothetical protein
VNKASSINIDTIAEILGVSTHTKNRIAIKETLLSMEEKGLILLYEDIVLTKKIAVADIKPSSTYHITTVDQEEECGFTKIYYSDILRFVSIEDKAKDLMFSVYFNIIKRIYDSESSPDYSWVTIDTIEEETGVNRKTIMNRLPVMMENEMLYFEKVNEGAEKDKNYYSRWGDRQKLIDFLRSQQSA